LILGTGGALMGGDVGISDVGFDVTISSVGLSVGSIGDDVGFEDIAVGA